MLYIKIPRVNRSNTQKQQQLKQTEIFQYTDTALDTTTKQPEKKTAAFLSKKLLHRPVQKLL